MNFQIFDVRFFLKKTYILALRLQADRNLDEIYKQIGSNGKMNLNSLCGKQLKIIKKQLNCNLIWKFLPVDSYCENDAKK